MQEGTWTKKGKEGSRYPGREKSRSGKDGNLSEVIRHPRKAPSILRVDWSAPSCSWIKANTDGTTKVAPGHTASGGIFRDKSGAVLSYFASYLGVSYALHAKHFAAMIAIEGVINGGGISFGWNVTPSLLYLPSQTLA